MIWLWLSAAFMVTTAGVHSVLGYRRMIVPLLRGIGATILDAPADYPRYGPTYYAVFFADPDGLKLEYVFGATSA